MWENAYLSIKNPKASRAHLSGPWTPATNCSLHSCDSASLRQQLSAPEPGTPLDQILDPHLRVMHICNAKLNLGRENSQKFYNAPPIRYAFAVTDPRFPLGESANPHEGGVNIRFC